MREAKRQHGTWPDSRNNAGAVAAGGPWVARVHAQDVEHVPEVQPYCAHIHLQGTPRLSLSAKQNSCFMIVAGCGSDATVQDQSNKTTGNWTLQASGQQERQQARKVSAWAAQAMLC